MKTLSEWYNYFRDKNPNEQEQLLIDYKETFLSSTGKRVLKDLDSKTTFSRCSFSDNKPIDVNKLIKDEAQRSIFLYILKQIHRTPVKKQERTNNG